MNALGVYSYAKMRANSLNSEWADMGLSGVFDALTLPAIMTDGGAQVIACNAAAKLYFGDVPDGSLIYLKFRQPETRSAFEAAMKSGEAAQFEYHERVPIERSFRVDVSRVLGEDSSVAGCLFVFRDTSLARAIERMRTDFVANASHELRTPLASITGFIETLQGPAKDDEKARAQFLGIMQTQAGRMGRLIDDLLSLSRLEMRPFADLTKAVDLKAVAEQVIASLKSVVDVEIVLDMEAGPMIITGVRDEIVEVMENLIENACKYGHAGERVIVSLKSEPGYKVLSVKDFGPGIAAEHIPRLTERFYRVDAGSELAQKGTGLGLAIVKHILSRHNARLSIQSRLGEGATFNAHFLKAD